MCILCDIWSKDWYTSYVSLVYACFMDARLRGRPTCSCSVNKINSQIARNGKSYTFGHEMISPQCTFHRLHRRPNFTVNIALFLLSCSTVLRDVQSISSVWKWSLEYRTLHATRVTRGRADLRFACVVCALTVRTAFVYQLLGYNLVLCRADRGRATSSCSHELMSIAQWTFVRIWHV